MDERERMRDRIAWMVWQGSAGGGDFTEESWATWDNPNVRHITAQADSRREEYAAADHILALLTQEPASEGEEEGDVGAHNYIVFRCDVDDSTIVSVEAPERGNDVYLGVAECPDMRTAQVVMESLRARESGPGKCEPSTTEGEQHKPWCESHSLALCSGCSVLKGWDVHGITGEPTTCNEGKPHEFLPKPCTCGPNDRRKEDRRALLSSPGEPKKLPERMPTDWSPQIWADALDAAREDLMYLEDFEPSDVAHVMEYCANVLRLASPGEQPTLRIPRQLSQDHTPLVQHLKQQGHVITIEGEHGGILTVMQMEPGEQGERVRIEDEEPECSCTKARTWTVSTDCGHHNEKLRALATLIIHEPPVHPTEVDEITSQKE